MVLRCSGFQLLNVAAVIYTIPGHVWLLMKLVPGQLNTVAIYSIVESKVNDIKTSQYVKHSLNSLQKYVSCIEVITILCKHILIVDIKTALCIMRELWVLFVNFYYYVQGCVNVSICVVG